MRVGAALATRYDQDGDDQQPEREMIDDGWSCQGWRNFTTGPSVLLELDGSKRARATNSGNCVARCAVCAVYRKAARRAQICGMPARGN